MKIAKTTLLLTGASLFLSAGISLSQAQSVSTIPVGYTTLDVPAGSALISPTFVNSDSFAGAIVSASGNDIVFASSTFTGSEYDEGGFPLYYLEISESGHAYEGQLFDIVSNTTDTVTVALGGGDLSSFSLTAGDSVVIRKHFTLNQLFESPDVALGAFTETAKFFNSDESSSLYTWTGSAWSSDFGVTDEGDRQIYPGEGILLTSSAARNLVVTGTVKPTKTRLPIFATNSVLVMVGSGSPSDTTLGELGLAQSLDDFTGTVKFLSNDGNLSSGTLYTDVGSYMSPDFGITDASSVVVPAGQPMIVTNGSTKTISLPAAYNP